VKDIMTEMMGGAWKCVNHWSEDNPWCNSTHRPPFTPLAGWTAVVDGSEIGLPDVPLRLINAGKINKSPTGEKVAVLMGTNTNEFSLFAPLLPMILPGISLPFTSSDFSTVATYLSNHHQFWDSNMADSMVEAYPRSEFKQEGARMIEAGTDFCFRCGTRIAARALASAGINVYLYRFDFHGPNWKDPESFECQMMMEETCGVSHGSEIKYLFRNVKKPTTSEVALTEAISTYWATFAKSGVPMLDGAVQWPLYNQTADNHLIFTSDGVPVVNHTLNKMGAKCDFWDTLPREGPYPH